MSFVTVLMVYRYRKLKVYNVDLTTPVFLVFIIDYHDLYYFNQIALSFNFNFFKKDAA